MCPVLSSHYLNESPSNHWSRDYGNMHWMDKEMKVLQAQVPPWSTVVRPWTQEPGCKDWKPGSATY